MRELKFRAIVNGGYVYSDSYENLAFYFDATSNYEQEQFTGLKDKNGKEVYEGDIIKWKTTRYHTKEQEEKQIAMPKYFKSPVLFCEGGFVVNECDVVNLNAYEYDTPLCSFFNDCIGATFDFKAQIIGNIYENPELLK